MEGAMDPTKMMIFLGSAVLLCACSIFGLWMLVVYYSKSGRKLAAMKAEFEKSGADLKSSKRKADEKASELMVLQNEGKETRDRAHEEISGLKKKVDELQIRSESANRLSSEKRKLQDDMEELRNELDAERRKRIEAEENLDKPELVLKPSEKSSQDSGDGEKGANLELLLRSAEEAEMESPKAEEPKPEEPKAEEPKAEEPKAEEPKAEEPKAEEPKAEEPKAEEPKQEEAPKPEEPKAEEPKAEEPKQEEAPKPEEPKAEEPKVEEPKAEEPKVEEPKAEEPKKEGEHDVVDLLKRSQPPETEQKS